MIELELINVTPESKRGMSTGLICGYTKNLMWSTKAKIASKVVLINKFLLNSVSTSFFQK
jgi:hypothetical protein